VCRGINASLKQTAVSTGEREQLLTQLGHVVEALKANFGVQVSANGEQMILVDESPSQERNDGTNGQHGFDKSSQGNGVVPVHASSAVEQMPVATMAE